MFLLSLPFQSLIFLEISLLIHHLKIGTLFSSNMHICPIVIHSAHSCQVNVVKPNFLIENDLLNQNFQA